MEERLAEDFITYLSNATRNKAIYPSGHPIIMRSSMRTFEILETLLEEKEEVKEEDYYRVETRFGKFTRSFTLPDHVDVENITASTQDGVLEVVLPKLPEVDKVKSIEIK